MSNALFTIATTIDAFQEPRLFIPILLGSAIVVGYFSRQHAAILVVTGVSAWLLSEGLKLLFTIPRPDTALVETMTYRFPSTHATVTSALVASIFLCGATIWKTQKIRLTLAVFFVISVSIVSWSRVYLNVHEWIDVTAGTVLGIGAALLFHTLLYRPTR